MFPLHVSSTTVVVILSFLLLSGASAAASSLDDEDASPPKHLGFFRGRRSSARCAGDPHVCSDREKNPWGGDTCCLGRYCRDTMRDGSNCGGCGVRCGFGLMCCGGKCVDVQSDPRHCGSCFEECRGECSFALCDYGG